MFVNCVKDCVAISADVDVCGLYLKQIESEKKMRELDDRINDIRHRCFELTEEAQELGRQFDKLHPDW